MASPSLVPRRRSQQHAPISGRIRTKVAKISQLQKWMGFFRQLHITYLITSGKVFHSVAPIVQVRLIMHAPPFLRLLFRYFLKPHCRGSVNILSSTPLHAACLSRRRQESALALQRSSHSWPWSTASIDSNRAPALRMKSRWEKGTKITSSIESCRPSKNYTLLFPDGRQNAIRNQSDNDQFHPRSITH